MRLSQDGGLRSTQKQKSRLRLSQCCFLGEGGKPNFWDPSHALVTETVNLIPSQDRNGAAPPGTIRDCSAPEVAGDRKRVERKSLVGEENDDKEHWEKGEKP